MLPTAPDIVRIARHQARSAASSASTITHKPAAPDVSARRRGRPARVVETITDVVVIHDTDPR